MINDHIGVKILNLYKKQPSTGRSLPADVMDNIPTWLEPLLNQGFIAPSDGFAFKHQHRLKPGQYFVSMERKMWSWNGTVYPSFDAGSAEILRQRQRLIKLEAALKSLEQKQQMQALKSDMQEAQKNLNQTQNQLKQQTKQKDILQKRLDQRTQEYDQLQQKKINTDQQEQL